MQTFLTSSPARRNRLLLVAGAILLALFILFQARAALFPFFLGLMIAYVLSPLVRKLEGILPQSWNQDRRRLLAVAQVYIVVLAALFLLGVFVLPVIVGQANNFILGLPLLLEEAQATIAALVKRYQTSVPPEVQRRLEGIVADLGSDFVAAIEAALRGSIAVVSQTFSILLGLLTVPVWLFYLLKDQRKTSQLIAGLLPARHREAVSELVAIVDKTLISYVRGQLFLGVVVGIMAWVGLSLLGVPFAPVLAIISGVTELIPVLGPILGAVPGILVVLATDPTQVIWVVLLYIGVQMVENTLLVPRVQGRAVSLPPALIMVLIVLASELAGFVGMLIVVPAAAVSRDVFVYLYRRFEAEERG